jgi:antitoxin HicB
MDTAAKLLDAMRRNPRKWSIEELVAVEYHILAPYFQPKDMSVPDLSGEFLTHVLKSVQAQLARRAKAEGVSLNTRVLTFIAEGLGRHESRV